MSPPGRLFGRKSNASKKQLQQALKLFYEADTWAASRLVLEANPELLSDAATALLEKEIRDDLMTLKAIIRVVFPGETAEGVLESLRLN